MKMQKSRLLNSLYMCPEVSTVTDKKTVNLFLGFYQDYIVFTLIMKRSVILSFPPSPVFVVSSHFSISTISFFGVGKKFPENKK